MDLAARAAALGCRLALVLAGDRAWTATVVAGVARALEGRVPGRTVWVTDRPVPGGGTGGAAEGTMGGACPTALHAVAVAPDRATRTIGSECGLLVVDAWSGLDPDGLGAASGTLRAGGLLVLLTPPFADWPGLADPQAARIAAWPAGAADCAGRFVARLARILESDSESGSQAPAGSGRESGTGLGVVVVRQDGPLPLLPADWDAGARVAGESGRSRPGPVADLDPARPATRDQLRAVAAILRTARGRARRPLVLTAHRGRGKSAALGIAAGRLARGGGRSILVTGPCRAACDAVFRHAAAAWPEAASDGGDLAQGCDAERPDNCQDGLGEGFDAGFAAGLWRAPGARAHRGALSVIRFVPPDALREAHPPADLLLVDEAAAIPAPLLADLLVRYPRAVFATTVHGYEGTGRGFELRFRATMDRLTPGWRALTLAAPIRWAPGDPLEALIFRALALDASPAAPGLSEGADLADCRFERLDRARLAADEATLSQLFGLLVLAHYRTRPLDLRLLLDAPGVRVYALRLGPDVVGTLLAAEEGGIDDGELIEAIFDGRRRPRGHLLPQTLSAHAGLAEAPRLRFLRAIRIAVHPALARRGLGRRLVEGLAADAGSAGFDLVGASFGATPELIAFWSACGCRPVQVGSARNAASGEHAVVVLRALGPAGAALVARAQQRLAHRLPVLLAGPLRGLDPRVAAALLAALDLGLERVRPSADGPAPGAGSSLAGGAGDGGQDPEVRSFATGHRTLEAALPALAELAGARLGAALRAGRIAPEDGALLVAALGQLRPPAELVEPFGARGRDAVVGRLRDLVGILAREDGAAGGTGVPPPGPQSSMKPVNAAAKASGRSA